MLLIHYFLEKVGAASYSSVVYSPLKENDFELTSH